MLKRIACCLGGQEAADDAKLMESKGMRRLAMRNRSERLAGIVSNNDPAVHCPHDLSGEVLEAVSARPH